MKSRGLKTSGGDVSPRFGGPIKVALNAFVTMPRLGSPHGSDKCIIGGTPANAGDTHTRDGGRRRARVHE